MYKCEKMRDLSANQPTAESRPVAPQPKKCARNRQMRARCNTEQICPDWEVLPGPWGMTTQENNKVRNVLIPNHIFFYQGCGSAFISSGSGSSILGLNTDPDPIRIRIRIKSGSRALMTKNWKKLHWKKNYIFFGSKATIYLSLGLHKESQVTEEAFSYQKRPSNTSKLEL